MIDEHQLQDYRKLFESKQDAPVRFVMLEIKEMSDTLEALWDLARSVRRWQRAFPGKPSVDAEADMIDILDSLKG